MIQRGGRFLMVIMILVACLVGQIARAERDQDQDDFDDSGFDDSGYNNPQSHEAEGSHHNPSSYSPSNEEDLDDDDDVDESNNVLVAADKNQPQSYYSSVNRIAMPIPAGTRRQKRAVHSENENDVEDGAIKRDSAQPLIRNRRHLKKRKYYIGPVYTYVKTNKHAHYKWGVKHKVGKHYG